MPVLSETHAFEFERGKSDNATGFLSKFEYRIFILFTDKELTLKTLAFNFSTVANLSYQLS